MCIEAQIEHSPGDGILEEFRKDFLDCWQRLPGKTLFFTLAAAWILLFTFFGNSTLGYVDSPSIFRWVLNAIDPNGNYAAADEGYSLFIPLVVLGILWSRRQQLLALPLQTWWPGLLLVALAVLLHLAGYMIQQPRLSVVALFAGLYGIMGMAWGPALLRGAFFPFFLFAFCVPIGVLGQPITFPLRLLVCRLVESIAPLLSIDVIREGTALHDPSNKFSYEVAAACSGMRSLIATLALSLCYAWMSFPKWWKRAVLIASAFPLAVLGNLLRMMAIVIAADIGGQPAGDYVHDGGPFGLISLLPYVPAFAGLILIGHWLRERTPEPALHLAVRTT